MRISLPPDQKKHRRKFPPSYAKKVEQEIEDDIIFDEELLQKVSSMFLVLKEY